MKNTWVDIDLRLLADNTRKILSELRPETSLIGVVKANAYGHGMIPVARTAARHGVKWFAVAHLHEALQLRRAVDDSVSILVLGTNALSVSPFLVRFADFTPPPPWH